jgi:hypothetical protein
VNTLLDSLKLQNPVLRNVFGLCFRGVGGQMSLGEVPSSWSSSEWQYTPVTKFGFWQVQFEDFVVANVSLGHSPIFNNPGIVDSVARKKKEKFRFLHFSFPKQKKGNSVLDNSSFESGAVQAAAACQLLPLSSGRNLQCGVKCDIV